MAADGTISVGVEVDDKELKSGLSKAESEIEKSFDKATDSVNDDLQEIGKTAEKAFDKAASSAVEASESIEEIADSADSVTDGIDGVSAEFDNVSSSAEDFGDNASSSFESVSDEIDNSVGAAQNLDDGFEAVDDTLNDINDPFEEISDNIDDTAASAGNADSEISSVASSADEAAQSVESISLAAEEAASSTEGMSTSADEASSSFGELGGGGVLAGIGALEVAIIAVGAAATAAVIGVKELVEEVSESGDKIDKASQRIGFSKKAYQEWDYILQLSGSSMDQAAMGIKTLTSKMEAAVEGNDAAIASFKEIGLSVDDLRGLSREDLFGVVIKQLQDMDESTKRATLANELLGRSGMTLQPLFNSSSEQTEKLIENYRELGAAMSDDVVQASADFVDAQTTLNATIDGVKSRIAGVFLPTFTKALTAITERIPSVEERLVGFIDRFIEYGAGIYDRIRPIIGSITALVGGIFDSVDVEEIYGGLSETIDAVIDTALTITEKLIPPLIELIKPIASFIIGVILPAIHDLRILAIRTIGDISEKLGGLVGYITPFVSSAIDSIPSIIESISSLITGLLDELSLLVSDAQFYIEEFLNLLNIESIASSFGSVIETIKKTVESFVNDTLPPIIEALTPIFEFVVNKIVPKLVELVPVIVGVIASLAEKIGWLIQTVLPPLAEFLGEIISRVWAIIEPLFQFVLDNIIPLITALMAVFETAWNFIKPIIESIISFLRGYFTELGKNLDAVWHVISDFVEIVVMVATALWRKWTEIFDAILKAAEPILKPIRDIRNAIFDAFGGIFNSMWNIGSDIVNGLVEGIKRGIDGVRDAAVGMADSAVNSVKDFLGIHSPSRVMIGIGVNMDEGQELGLKKGEKSLIAQAKRIGQNVAENMRADLSAPYELTAKAGNVLSTQYVTNTITTTYKIGDIDVSNNKTATDAIDQLVGAVERYSAMRPVFA